MVVPVLGETERDRDSIIGAVGGILGKINLRCPAIYDIMKIRLCDKLKMLADLYVTE
jgi:hypothetical protein